MEDCNWVVRARTPDGTKPTYPDLVCYCPDRETARTLAAFWSSTSHVECIVYVMPRVGAEVEIDRFVPTPVEAPA